MLFYYLFQYFEEKKYQTETNRNETFGSAIFGKDVIWETWSSSQGWLEEATRVEGAPPIGRAPCLMGPSGVHRRTSSSYISLRTPKTSREQTKHNFHRRNLLIREIPSWSLHQHSARGGIDHGGLLHQHPCPSDEF